MLEPYTSDDLRKLADAADAIDKHYGETWHLEAKVVNDEGVTIGRFDYTEDGWFGYIPEDYDG